MDEAAVADAPTAFEGVLESLDMGPGI